MTIDIISLIAGVVVAAALGIGIYSQRKRITNLRSSAQQRVSVTRDKLTRGTEATYREAVINLSNELHAAGHLIPLEDIAVSPRFYSMPQPFDPLEEENPDVERPHYLMPLAPDWPQAVAPYCMPTIELEQLLRGDQSVALLGQPGSGRTVTLALIAQRIARQTQAQQAGNLADELRLPLYFHLGDINLDAARSEEGANPLQLMVDAAAPRLRGLASRLVSAVQGEFAAGNGIILADGWDELPLARRLQVVEWLRVVIESFPGNKLVVAAGAQGYGPLLEIGLAPVFMAPWHDPQWEDLSRRWAAAWPRIAAAQRAASAAEPTDDLIRRASRGNRMRTPLDATLHVWATYAGDDPGRGRAGWYEAYLNRVLPVPELRPALSRAAEMLFENPGRLGLSLEDMTSVVNTTRSGMEGRVSMLTADFIFDTTNKVHVLLEHTDGSLQFAHPTVQGYLAAEATRSRELDPRLLTNPQASRLTMPFLAQMRDVTPYVERRLAERPTVLQEHLLEMASWAADAEPQAKWRGLIFKRLADLLLNPSEFPATRERAMAALVASRDPNVSFIFREGLKSDNPRIRFLCTIGLGALGDPENVTILGDRTGDPDPLVEVATALALGAIGARSVVNFLIQVLVNRSDLARRAAAEMLGASNLAGEGHEVLREAAAEENPLTRKAAVYGLDRVEQPWAIEKLEEMEKRDGHWMVRAAASLVMDARRANKPLASVPRHPRRPDETLWLAKWLEERKESITPGPQGLRQLLRALQDGDEVARLAAAEALAALGVSDAISTLYTALRDEHPEIREGAHRALGTISLATGHALPGVR
jgi:HEAT repeat protein